MRESLQGNQSRTGAVTRKKREIRMSDSEWGAINAEADRLGLGVSESIRRRFSQPDDDPSGSLGNGIPDEVVLEALVDAIHLHGLFERRYEELGMKGQFDELLDGVRKSHSPAVHEELVPELMVREGLVAIIHLHLLFRESHDRTGKLDEFERLWGEVKSRLRIGGSPRRGGR